jgi:hypothetical protein
MGGGGIHFDHGAGFQEQVSVAQDIRPNDRNSTRNALVCEIQNRINIRIHSAYQECCACDENVPQ